MNITTPIEKEKALLQFPHKYFSYPSSETYIIFSGGLSCSARMPSITVIHGKTTTVLEMEHTVVDFITLCETPYTSGVYYILL